MVERVISHRFVVRSVVRRPSASCFRAAQRFGKSPYVIVLVQAIKLAVCDHLILREFEHAVVVVLIGLLHQARDLITRHIEVNVVTESQRFRVTISKRLQRAPRPILHARRVSCDRTEVRAVDRAHSSGLIVAVTHLGAERIGDAAQTTREVVGIVQRKIADAGYGSRLRREL